MRSLIRTDYNNPISDLFNFWNEEGSLLEPIFGSRNNVFQRRTFPIVDLVENKDKYLVRAELPGVKAEEIALSIDNGVLTLKGEKKCTYESTEGAVHKVESTYGSFTRSFKVPSNVNADAISSTYKNGILEISLPKIEDAKEKKIDINAE